MKRIGIVGAGIAGLHLGLFLQQQGVSATIYAEQTAEQQLAGRLPSIVTRFAATRERERQLGVNHWDTPDFGVFCFYVNVTGDYPLSFRGDVTQPALVVDMRIYQATLLQDFMARGGEVVFGTLQPDDLAQLATTYDLLVVASGRRGFTDLFPRIPELSPYTRPQRRLCGALFNGINYPDPLGIEVTMVPNHGDVSAIPIYSFGGHQSALFFEAIPGGAFEQVTRMRYEDDPGLFNATVLQLMQQHAPNIAARINPAEFGLTRPLDIVQGEITPTFRRGYAQLANGRCVMALGDAHVVNDPLFAQGANAASYAAWALGEAILESSSYDEAFCQGVEARVSEYLQAASAWTNQALGTPPAYLGEVFVAAAQNQVIANALVDQFGDPIRGWEVAGSAEGAAAFLDEFGWVASESMAAVA